MARHVLGGEPGMVNSNGVEACLDLCDGWTCSLDVGHLDDHAAYGSHQLKGPPITKWVNEYQYSIIDEVPA